MKGIQQFCTNLHNSFTANPPATEKKLIDTVGGLPSRAEVEKITQSIAEIGELRKLIGKVETEALQRMASNAVEVDERFNLYMTKDQFVENIGNITSELI